MDVIIQFKEKGQLKFVNVKTVSDVGLLYSVYVDNTFYRYPVSDIESIQEIHTPKKQPYE